MVFIYSLILIFVNLGIYLRRNTVLKELSLAHNDLTSSDAFTIGIVLKSNFYLQFLDVSNNRIEVGTFFFCYFYKFSGFFCIASNI